MAYLEIPIRNDLYSYSIDVVLDAQSYTLSFIYNFRDEKWYMAIDGYVGSKKLTLQYDIFRLHKYIEGFPQGNFICVDKTDMFQEPDINNFGVTVALIYEEAS